MCVCVCVYVGGVRRSRGFTALAAGRGRNLVGRGSGHWRSRARGAKATGLRQVEVRQARQVERRGTAHAAGGAPRHRCCARGPLCPCVQCQLPTPHAYLAYTHTHTHNHVHTHTHIHPPPRQNCFIRPDDLRLIDCVGAGAEGTVWRGRWHHIDVAVKEMHTDSASYDKLVSIAKVRACRACVCVRVRWICRGIVCVAGGGFRTNTAPTNKFS